MFLSLSARNKGEGAPFPSWKASRARNAATSVKLKHDREDPSHPTFQRIIKQVRVPLVPHPYRHALSSQGLVQESTAGPFPKTTESCRTGAPQAKPAPNPAGPAPTPDPERPLRGGGDRGCGGQGAGGAAAATASLSFRVWPPTPGATAEGGRDGLEGGPDLEPPEAARRALFPRPWVCEWARGTGN